ncbi:cell envelope integrity protein TolA [Dyella monticola]|uniref:Cell envelope integrity protein TolA n=1 Tax=Dyella monticola TaxID=1927958 RepID=A0A370X8D7_9GAMM|nr:cell envelope integrity protein TolA [Dyella monticola]RDS84495.1 cell envelope integrity protein TolA [Dyella monticola]
MEDRNAKGTPLAVVLSAVLHLGIVAFLFLALLPCTTYEKFLTALHLPNPITCTPPPLQLSGPPIEATLIGNTAAPPPKSVKVKPIPNTVPPPPSIPPPPPPQVEQPKVSQLPPPPEHPDVVDQERVVQEALQKAEDAKKEQEEKERQRQAELDAQAAKKKAEQQKVDELFKQLDAASAQTQKADSKAKQAKQQLADLKNAQLNGQENLPNAPQTQTGNNSNSTLLSQYLAAIQNAVTQNWIRPDNMPDAPCVVHIVQIPGGQVLSAKASANCPYDAAGKKSVEDAVLRAQPLPYQGFEKVFQRDINFTFRPQ